MFKNIKKFSMFFLTAVMMSTVFSGLDLPAYAGGFTHVHSSACNRSVSKTCTHFLRYGKEFSNQNCPKCGRVTQFRMDTWTDVCPSGERGERFVAWTTQCESCGYVSDERGCPPPDSHSYSVVERACGMSEGASAATVSAGASSTEWTNSDVTVSVSVSVTDPTFSVTSVSFSGGGSGTSATVSSNGTYSFTVNGSNGQSVTESVTVSNIDKSAPSLSLSKSPDSWTEEGVTVSASASDDLSGVAGFSFNGGGYGSSSSWHVSSNGTYSVSVRDNAGNESSSSITISNIGKDPAIEEARKREEEEKRKREEEERRKREEEERRKREQETSRPGNNNSSGSGSSSENSSGGGKATGNGSSNSSKNGKNTGSSSKNSDFDKLLDNKEQSLNDISGNGISGQDVSQNDVSAGDVSANMISVTHYPDPGEKPKATVVSSGMSLDPVTTAETGKRSFLSILADKPWKFLFASLLLLMAAAVMFLSFNILYTVNDGRFKPIGVVDIDNSGEKSVVRLPAVNLEKNREYRIFFSLSQRLMGHRDKMMVDTGGEQPIPLNKDGRSFTFM